MKCLALDVGGANVKHSDGEAVVGSSPFALWRQPERLAERLRAIVTAAGATDRIAVTMTGELADCFASKSEGVASILRSVQLAVDHQSIRVYLTDGRLVDPATAVSQPLLAAASNWHVLARFAGRFAPSGSALLLDIGSTTCDVIPLVDGYPAASGQDDTSRLLSGELVYTGIERSPVCAVAGRSVYRGRPCPLAQELFATMRDVYLVLGELPEVPSDRETADGRPATRDAAISRLGRMICADDERFGATDATELARTVAKSQRDLVANAVRQVTQRMCSPPATVIVSGHGPFLARRVLADVASSARVVSLEDELGPQFARAATAHALAVLAREDGSR